MRKGVQMLKREDARGQHEAEDEIYRGGTVRDRLYRAMTVM